jgi:hypothetical protein
MGDRIALLHALIVTDRNQLACAGERRADRNAAFFSAFSRLRDCRLHEFIRFLIAHHPILCRKQEMKSLDFTVIILKANHVTLPL